VETRQKEHSYLFGNMYVAAFCAGQATHRFRSQHSVELVMIEMEAIHQDTADLSHFFAREIFARVMDGEAVDTLKPSMAVCDLLAADVC
jgi:hypothetical protein